MKGTAICIVGVASALLTARAAQACTSDNECKGSRVCQSGACVEPPEDSRAASEALEAMKASRAHAGVYANVLGVVQFGPTVAFEVGSKFAPFLRLRAVSAGVIPHVLAANSDDKLKLSFGAAAGFRVYTGRGNLRGFYVGGAAEYLYLRIDEGNGKKPGAEIQYVTHMLVPQGELGYRWVFGKGFSFGVGGALGYAAVLSADTKYELAGTAYTEEGLRADDYVNAAEPTPYAAFGIELGAVF